MPRNKQTNGLTVVCSPRYLFICHITTQSNNRLYIHSATKIMLENLELEHLVVFNPTAIARHINNTHASLLRSNIPLFVGLYGPSIKESCINIASAHPTYDQLPISHAPHWQWDYCYLYPWEYSYYFYLCGIPRELILQFKLLALQHNWNMLYLSSERMALLQVYRHLFGTVFRPSQLGLHMQQKNNNIDALLSRDDLARIATLSTHITATPNDDLVGPLLASCGLFIAGTSYA